MSDRDLALALDDVVVEFATPGGPLRAVDGVSFELERGKALGIVGESGSGKSVLSRSVMNILAGNGTRTGTIEVNGRDIDALTKAERKHFWGVEVAMVFQDPMSSLNPVKRIGAQLTESLRYHLEMSRSEANHRAIELLDQVHIPAATTRLTQYPHELSGGMRQRVLIAIALACDPKMVIADEPTTALDVTVQKKILDLLDELRRDRDMSLILITHDLGVARGRTDDVAVMYAGRIAELAPTETLFVDSRHPYTEALLRSIPRIDRPSHSRLSPIPGRPPDLLTPPPGCAFAARCRHARPDCLQSVPELTGTEGMQRYACFHPVGTERGRMALAVNEEAGVTAAGMAMDETREEVA